MPSRPAVHSIVSSDLAWPAHTGWDDLGAAVEPVDADELFATLDGRSITTPQGAWFVEIQSIFDDPRYRWIQLTLTGDPPYTLTFRVNPGDDADEAVRALSLWLSTTASQDVM
jgi:hypothetical protein